LDAVRVPRLLPDGRADASSARSVRLAGYRPGSRCSAVRPRRLMGVGIEYPTRPLSSACAVAAQHCRQHQPDLLLLLLHQTVAVAGADDHERLSHLDRTFDLAA